MKTRHLFVSLALGLGLTLALLWASGTIERAPVALALSQADVSAERTVLRPQAVISPTSSFVLYHREDDDGIWLKTAISHTRIMTGAHPRLSPDGRYIVYQDTIWSGDWRVRDLQTGQDTLLYDVRDISVGAAWTGDGSHILFDHECYIYAIEPDGSNLTKIIDRWPDVWLDYCYNDNPDSNPVDGRVVWENERYGLGLADADGGNPHWIPNTQVDDYDPRWSPDGQWIAFWRDDNLYKIKPDGSGLTQLTFLTAAGDWVEDAGPWTPDGRYQVVAAIVNGAKGLYAVPTDGSGRFSPIVSREWVDPDWVGSAGDVTGLWWTVYLPLVLRNDAP